MAYQIQLDEHGRVTRPTLQAALGDIASSVSARATAAQGALADTLAAANGDLIARFGAAGDGVKDDRAALVSALSSGIPLDGRGRTFKLSAPVDLPEGLVLSNAKFVFPALDANATAMTMAGSSGTTQTLPADIPRLATSIVVPDATKFIVFGWAYIESDALWSSASGGGVKMGELLRISAVDAATNTLTLCWPTLNAYATTQGARITPENMLRGPTLTNVDFVGTVSAAGAGTANRALALRRVVGAALNNVSTHAWDRHHIELDRAAHVRISGGSGGETGFQTGVDYGVMIVNASFDATVRDRAFHAMRHGVTIGGAQGVNRFIRVDGCRCYDMRDAGFDAHPGAAEHEFTNNVVLFRYYEQAGAEYGNQDGVMTQGSQPRITNNVFINCRENGVAWQPFIAPGVAAPVVGLIANNDMSNAAGLAQGVFVEVKDAVSAPIQSAVIENNRTRGFSRDVMLQTQINGAGISNVSIRDHDGVGGDRSVYLNARAGSVIDGLAIDGGALAVTDAATNPVVDFVSTATSDIKNVRISNARIARGAGGTVGIRTLGRVTGLVERGTTWGNVTTRFSLSADTTGAQIGSPSSFKLTAAPTYTVPAHLTSLTVDRAETVTLTLPAPAAVPDRVLRIRTLRAFAVVSAASDVIPITGGAAGTAILPATAGAWAELRSDGVAWEIVAA